MFLPVIEAPGPCFGGSACAHDFSLSCAVFGFGDYDDIYGGYFFTYNCTGFV